MDEALLCLSKIQISNYGQRGRAHGSQGKRKQTLEILKRDAESVMVCSQLLMAIHRLRAMIASNLWQLRLASIAR